MSPTRRDASRHQPESTGTQHALDRGDLLRLPRGHALRVRMGQVVMLLDGSPVQRLDGQLDSDNAAPPFPSVGEDVQALATENSLVEVFDQPRTTAQTLRLMSLERASLDVLRRGIELPAHGDRMLCEVCPWVGRVRAQIYEIEPDTPLSLPRGFVGSRRRAFVLLMTLSHTGPEHGRAALTYRQVLVSVPTLRPLGVHILRGFSDSPAGLLLGRNVAGHPFRLLRVLPSDDEWFAVLGDRIAIEAPLVAPAPEASTPTARTWRVLQDMFSSALDLPHSSLARILEGSVRPEGTFLQRGRARLTTTSMAVIRDPQVRLSEDILAGQVRRGWIVEGAYELRNVGRSRRRWPFA